MKIHTSNLVVIMGIILIFYILAYASSKTCKSKFHQNGIIGKGEYSLDSCDYVIKKDSVVEIEAGTKIKCSIFSAIKVFGILLCKGTEENPIILESAQKKWLGIDVLKGGLINLSNVQINNAVIGVNVQDSQAIQKLENITFYNNDVNVMIYNNSDINSNLNTGNKVYTFIKPEKNNAINTTVDTLPSLLSTRQSKKAQPIISYKVLNFFTYLSGGVLLGACGGYLYNEINKAKCSRLYKSAVTIDEADKYEKYIKKYTSNSRKFLLATGITLPIFVATITFKKLKKD